MTYSLHTDKSWYETTRQLGETFDKWGVFDWTLSNPRGSRSMKSYQEEDERTVRLSYTLRGKQVSLVMGTQARAVDNLRVLYLAVEAMRMNEKRGISDVIESAYLQLAAPQQERSPWEVLGIIEGSPLEVAEAAYKVRARKAHPDAGGSEEQMKALNKVIEEIRNSYTQA